MLGILITMVKLVGRSRSTCPLQEQGSCSVIYGRMVPQASRPQSFSLNDLLRRHCRDRLYVPPLHWSAKHLELLKCQFVPRRHTPKPANSTQARLTPPSESEQSGENSKHPPKQEDIRLQRSLRRLARGNDLLFKQWGLRHLLKSFSNDQIVTSLP